MRRSEHSFGIWIDRAHMPGFDNFMLCVMRAFVMCECARARRVLIVNASAAYTNTHGHVFGQFMGPIIDYFQVKRRTHAHTQ